MIYNINIISKKNEDFDYTPLLNDYCIESTCKQYNKNQLSYQPLKAYYRIMLNKLLKICSFLFSDEVNNHINKFCFNGPKSKYYNIVSYIAYIFKYYIYYIQSNEFFNDKSIFYKLSLKEWKLYNITHPFYHPVNDDIFLDEPNEHIRYHKQRHKRNDEIYNRMYNAIIKLENEKDIKDLKIILLFLKPHIDCCGGISCVLL